MLKEVRPEITKRVTNFSARRELWYTIVDSEVLALLRAGKKDAASDLIRQLIDAAVSSTSDSRTSDDGADQ
jgi:hypothetical protein